jgi:hypothetical protein
LSWTSRKCSGTIKRSTARSPALTDYARSSFDNINVTKILTMTNIHDTNIELLNDLYLIVAGTDLSNSKINKTKLHAYIYQQIEIEENKFINSTK